HQLEHVDHAAREAVLVVVPDEELGHAAHGAGQLAVDDGRVRVADDVGGDDRVGGEAHHALEAALGGAFDAGVDLVGRRLALQQRGDVGDGADRGRDAQRGAVEDAIQLRQHLAHRLRGAGAGGDDVGGGAARAADVLVRRVEDV